MQPTWNDGILEHEWSQYSIIPLFHYSNCERSELSLFVNFQFRHHFQNPIEVKILCQLYEAITNRYHCF